MSFLTFIGMVVVPSAVLALVLVPVGSGLVWFYRWVAGIDNR